MTANVEANNTRGRLHQSVLDVSRLIDHGVSITMARNEHVAAISEHIQSTRLTVGELNVSVRFSSIHWQIHWQLPTVRSARRQPGNEIRSRSHAASHASSTARAATANCRRCSTTPNSTSTTDPLDRDDHQRPPTRRLARKDDDKVSTGYRSQCQPATGTSPETVAHLPEPQCPS